MTSKLSLETAFGKILSEKQVQTNPAIVKVAETFFAEKQHELSFNNISKLLMHNRHSGNDPLVEDVLIQLFYRADKFLAVKTMKYGMRSVLLKHLPKKWSSLNYSLGKIQNFLLNQWQILSSLPLENKIELLQELQKGKTIFSSDIERRIFLFTFTPEIRKAAKLSDKLETIERFAAALSSSSKILERYFEELHLDNHLQNPEDLCENFLLIIKKAPSKQFSILFVQRFLPALKKTFLY